MAAKLPVQWEKDGSVRVGAKTYPAGTSVPVFARIVAREINPAKAMLEGDFEVEGDFRVAQRLGEMFGEPPSW